MHLARSLATSLHHGRHRSLARGGSAEFYDFRPYSSGDPMRLVDWRLFGRTDRVYLRRYQQESQISLVLVVDASESMRFSGLEPSGVPARGATKLRRVCELAAVLAHLAVKGGDRVGLVVSGSPERQIAPIPPSAGWPVVHRIIATLESLLKPMPGFRRRSKRAAPGDAATNPLAAGLAEAEALTRRSGLVIALSDALDELSPLLAAASRLRFAGAGTFAAAGAGRRDLALVQVLSDDELAWSFAGAAKLTDPESGLQIEADLDEIADSYRSAIESHIASLRRGLIAAGGRHVLAPLSQPAIDVLKTLLGA